MTGKPAGARPNRTGDPWQRKSDGRWCARVWPADGSGSKPKYVYGATRGEVLAKVHGERYDTQAPTRPKTTRITVDLDPDDYAALIRQAAGAAAASGRRVSLAETVRTMIRAANFGESPSA